MRAHVFQHLVFEGPGNIQPWLEKAGYRITYTIFSESAEIPRIEDVDFLVIMGGSMSVNEEEKLPWLIREKQFVRDFIAAGKPVLGICLGSQMIASAMGAKVYRNAEKEIGWFPVHGIKNLPQSYFRFPVSFTPLHWHGETFDLPEGAVLLASSKACKNQAFQIGRNVLAIQFHPEVTRETLNDFVFHFKKELVPARFIQSEEGIISVETGRLVAMAELMTAILNFLLKNAPEFKI